MTISNMCIGRKVIYTSNKVFILTYFHFVADGDSVELASASVDEGSNDITDDTSNGINDVISHIDQLLDAMQETDADIIDDIRDDITETGSDITVLDFTDDDISDDEAAPTMFLVQSVVETVPYATYSDTDQDSNISFEVIEEAVDEKTAVVNEVEITEVPAIRMTQSGILLTLPPPGGTDGHTEELDGVMESDLEYESLNSTISGGRILVTLFVVFDMNITKLFSCNCYLIT